MKFLVDSATNLVRGTYEAPLNFSISGKYIIDVPDSIQVVASTTSSSDLITAKLNKLGVLSGIPSNNQIFDEFLDTSKIDTAPPGTASTRFLVGPGKRTAIFPGGNLVTPSFSLTSGSAKVYFHYYAFLLSHGSQTGSEPGKMLYNYVDPSGFTDFVPSNFLVEIRNSGNTATLLTVTPDVTVPQVFAPGTNVRFRFTNLDTKTWHMSDWCFIYG